MRMEVRATGVGFVLLGIDSPGVVQREWDKAIRQAATITVWYWITDLLEPHFRRGNKERYKGQFFKRHRRTMRKKAGLYGHQILLVNYPEGLPPHGKKTLESMMMNQIPEVKSNSKGAAARWRTPGISPVYSDEATAVNEEDARIQANVLHRALYDIIVSGRAKLKKSAKRGMTRERLRRMKRIRIS